MFDEYIYYEIIMKKMTKAKIYNMEFNSNLVMKSQFIRDYKI